VPDRSRLNPEDALRFDAASAAAVRQREDAVRAYRQLVDRKPGEAGRWIDLGRAQEVAGHVPEAIAAYEKAVAADDLSAAAHLRLGVLQFRVAKAADGRASIDRAIDQYRKLGRTEGEAEALVRKAVALGPSTSPDECARSSIRWSNSPAQTGILLNASRRSLGSPSWSMEPATRLTPRRWRKELWTTPMRANLPTLAAPVSSTSGVTCSARAARRRRRPLRRSRKLANEHGSTRTENRAKLMQASIRIQSNQYQPALDFAEGPAAYFKKAGEAGLVVDADLILSRAYEGLDQFNARQ
jgi:tetratricopeptide (TPR) repeat protein